MAIRKILVPLSGQYDPEDPESLEKPALETAIALGRRLSAHVEVFCIAAQPSETFGYLSPWLPTYGMKDVLDMVAKESDKRRERAATLFEQVASAFSAPRLSAPEANTVAGFSVNFIKQVGTVHASVPVRGRLADLIVTACLPVEQNGIMPTILEAALRETGRPVLISPPNACEAFGKKIAIAWNGSAEAARAVGSAMEFLEAADEVVVISAKENGAFEPAGDSLAEYLRWHGVPVSIVSADDDRTSPGERLLNQVAQAQADMLLMGAYTRNPLQQLISGGVTTEVLEKMPVPVLMVD